MYGSKYTLVTISRCVYEEYIHVSDSQSGMILPPRGHLVIPGFIFGCHTVGEARCWFPARGQ